MKVYTGIGSRSTPDEVKLWMHDIGFELARRGWTLRSGCAPGADQAFESGAFDACMAYPFVKRPELYLPWPRFEGRRNTIVKLSEPQPEAFGIAQQFHPMWYRLTDGAKSLHARNVHQILGPDVTIPILPRFVICWTANGHQAGGTGQALRIARRYGVPIFDLAIQTDCNRVMGMFDSEDAPTVTYDQ